MALRPSRTTQTRYVVRSLDSLLPAETDGASVWIGQSFLSRSSLHDLPSMVHSVTDESAVSHSIDDKKCKTVAISRSVGCVGNSSEGSAETTAPSDAKSGVLGAERAGNVGYLEDEEIHADGGMARATVVTETPTCEAEDEYLIIPAFDGIVDDKALRDECENSGGDGGGGLALGLSEHIPGGDDEDAGSEPTSSSEDDDFQDAVRASESRIDFNSHPSSVRLVRRTVGGGFKLRISWSSDESDEESEDSDEEAENSDEDAENSDGEAENSDEYSEDCDEDSGHSGAHSDATYEEDSDEESETDVDDEELTEGEDLLTQSTQSTDTVMEDEDETDETGSVSLGESDTDDESLVHEELMEGSRWGGIKRHLKRQLDPNDRHVERMRDYKRLRGDNPDLRASASEGE